MSYLDHREALGHIYTTLRLYVIFLPHGGYKSYLTAGRLYVIFILLGGYMSYLYLMEALCHIYNTGRLYVIFEHRMAICVI